MIVAHGTLVVAADGGGAVVYRNTGQDGAVRLETVETIDAKNSSFTRDEGTDRPGRLATPAGGKTALAGHDYHEQGEQEFAKKLVVRLDVLIGPHGHGKAQPGVVLFASPRFLGMIRPAYSTHLKGLLKAEVAKDLRAATPKAIEHALEGLDKA